MLVEEDKRASAVEGILHSKSRSNRSYGLHLQHDEKIICRCIVFKHPKLDSVIGRYTDKGKQALVFQNSGDIGSRVVIKLTNSLLNINISDPMVIFMLKGQAFYLQ